MTRTSDSSDKAAEREKSNPKCSVCNVFQTNHYCSFVSAEGTQCSKPVCATCKGENGPTRCSDHLWSDRIWNIASGPSIEATNVVGAAAVAKNKRRIVAKKVQQLCSECKKHSTSSVCVECKVPVCTSCKLQLNGSLGSYCCSLHAKKVEISVVVQRPMEGPPVGKPTDATTTTEKNDESFLSPAMPKKKKAKSGKATNAFVGNDTDSLLHKAVCYDIESEIGKEIRSQLNCMISSSSLRDNCIVGTVTRKLSNRIASGQVIYEVSWNNSAFGTMHMSHSSITSGIENYLYLEHQAQQSQLSQQIESFRDRRSRRLDPYNHQDILAIIENSHKEDPEMSPCSSGTDSDESNDSNSLVGNAFFGETHMDRTTANEPYAQDNEYLSVSDDDSSEKELSQTNVDTLEGLDWDPRATLPPRPAKMAPWSSTIKPQFVRNFDTPISSFCSFLPQAMWEKIIFESNKISSSENAKA